MAYPVSQTASAKRNVVITGAGILTSLGNGWDRNAAGFRAGEVALPEISLFDVSQQRAKRGGQANLPASLPGTNLTARQESRMDRAARMLLLAASEALTQAGWEPSENQAMPLCLGTSAGAMALGEAYYRQAVNEPRRRTGQSTRIHHYQVQRQAALVIDAFDLGAEATIVSNACASGANAIGHAKQRIASGRANRVLAGGYDALAQLVFAGFDSLQALSTTQPRPFDAQRDGLAIGEGAGLLVLEAEETAQERGAAILAQVSGYGAANDIHHLTQPHPEGIAAAASMTMACRDAGLSPGEIGYINSHGTGTPLNDSAEAKGIAQWAGGAVSKIAVSSTKASVGHLLGGAGAVEAVVALMALRGGWLPPTTVVREVDPVVGFDLVRTPREAALDAVLTNSFGFGGANATVLLTRYAS